MAEKELKVSNYVGEVISNIVFLVLLNLLPRWNLSVLTDRYTEVLWAINLSLAVRIAGNFILVFIHPRFLHHLFNAAFALVSIIPIAVFISIFPFSFSTVTGPWLDKLLKIALIIALAATILSVIVHLVKFLGRLFRPGD